MFGRKIEPTTEDILSTMIDTAPDDAPGAAGQRVLDRQTALSQAQSLEDYSRILRAVSGPFAPHDVWSSPIVAHDDGHSAYACNDRECWWHRATRSDR